MKKIPWYMLLLFALIWVAIPFVLDNMLLPLLVVGKNTNFDNQTWFAFLGSYFPTTAFGLLTLYNSYLIKVQQDQLKELQTRKRFRLTGSSTLNSFNQDDHTIAGYTIKKLMSKFDSSVEIQDVNFEEGYLLNFYLGDTEEQRGIEKIAVKSIDWTMGPEDDILGEVLFKNSWKTGPHNAFAVFWIYKKNEDFRRKRVKCMNNQLLALEDYYKSTMVLKLKARLNDKEQYSLKVIIELECTENPTQLRAIYSDCIVE